MAQHEGTEQVQSNASPQDAEKAILAVLAGACVYETAGRYAMEPTELVDAIELYRAAGYAALEAHTPNRNWCQAQVEFTDRDTAERIAATHLWPKLRHAEAEGVVSSWWFIRKPPCWRLRCRPGSAATPTQTKTFINRVLDGMRSQRLIAGWRETIYEPEAYAFGGPKGMQIAHQLFHADSRNTLDYLRQHGLRNTAGRTIGRRELSILLCSTLMRGAGHDWHEQGDVWHRVAQHRPLPPDTKLANLRQVTPALRRLMSVDASQLVNDNGPLAAASEWLNAFEQAGKALADAARDEKLSRGVRDILAHHIIFHWNRVGLSSRTQSILADAAVGVVFEE